MCELKRNKANKMLVAKTGEKIVAYHEFYAVVHDIKNDVWFLAQLDNLLNIVQTFEAEKEKALNCLEHYLNTDEINISLLK